MARTKAAYPITSFSRLEEYQTCSHRYKRKYIDKVYPPSEFQEHFVKGSFVHSVLEELLDPETKTTNIDDALYIHFSSFLKDLQTDIDLEEAWEFGNKFGYLIWRTTEMCKDPTLMIRNSDKTICKSIKDFPSNSWKKALAESKLSKDRFKYDNQAAKSNKAFIKLSFSYFIGEIFALIKGFEVPSWITKTVSVEKGFSTNETDKLLLPGQTNLYFTGFLDWVVEDDKGQIIILDHKTSKKKPSQQEVQNFPQLNLYAWGYYLVYGILPDLIGIHHVRTGEYILARVKKDIVKRTLSFYANIQKEGIDQNSFIKKHPTSYNSPCIKKDWRTNEVTEVCPFLSECWPEFVETLKDNADSTHDMSYVV